MYRRVSRVRDIQLRISSYRKAFVFSRPKMRAGTPSSSEVPNRCRFFDHFPIGYQRRHCLSASDKPAVPNFQTRNSHTIFLLDVSDALFVSQLGGRAISQTGDERTEPAAIKERMGDKVGRLCRMGPKQTTHTNNGEHRVFSFQCVAAVRAR